MPEENKIDVNEIKNAAATKAADTLQAKAAEIVAIGKAHDLAGDAAEFIANGKSVDEFKDHVITKLTEKGKITTVKGDAPSPEIGMEENDIKNYSLFKAIRAAADKDWSNAGLEREANIAVANHLGREANGFFVPYDVLSRDMTVGTDTAGGHLVGTTHMSGSFIDMLRNKAQLAALGAQMLDGLVGNVDIPKQTGGATFYWIDEAGDTTESALTMGNLALTPKTVSGRVDMTRRLLKQSSPSVEQLVRRDLAIGVGLAIDLAGINGSGASGQPTGILNTTGIGDVAGGTNGLAPTESHIIDLETEVAVDNADIGNLAYLVNAVTRGKLKKTDIGTDTGLRVWDRQSTTPLNGYRAAVSNQVPSDLDKGTSTGVCSAILFGNFADVIIALWGGLDIKVDDVTLGDSGGLVLRVFQDLDIGLRNAQSMAAMQDALTA